MPAKVSKVERLEVREPASCPAAASQGQDGGRARPSDDAARPRAPLESHWISVRGARMHFYAGGWLDSSVRPVVLVHGLVMASRYMIPTASRLAPLGPVYAVDLPGYGWSEKPPVILSLPKLADAIAEWMRELSLARAHFVANSFGCQILTLMAVRHPQLVDRLVLQGPTVDPEARTLIHQVKRIVINSRRESPGLGLLMAKDYWHAGIRRIVATIRMALQDRMEDRLPNIEAPTLVVRGEYDPLVPPRWAETVARLLPNGTLVTIKDAGHTINYAEPDQFVQAIRPFLEL